MLSRSLSCTSFSHPSHKSEGETLKSQDRQLKRLPILWRFVCISTIFNSFSIALPASSAPEMKKGFQGFNPGITTMMTSWGLREAEGTCEVVLFVQTLLYIVLQMWLGLFIPRGEIALPSTIL